MLLLVLIRLITAESFNPLPNEKYEKFSQKALFKSIPFPTPTKISYRKIMRTSLQDMK